MATLIELHQELEDKLDNPVIRYQAGLIKTILERGARFFWADMPYHKFEGKTQDLELEHIEPPGSSVRSAYARTVVTTNPKVARIPVPVKALMRDVETPIKGAKLNSRFFKQRDTRLRANIKKLAKDLITSTFYGMGIGDNLWGLEYYLQGIAGHTNAAGTRSFPNDTAQVEWAKNTEQKLFATTAGTPGDYGNAKPLDNDLLNEFHTLCGENGFRQVACTKKAFLAVESILDAMPGNTGTYIKNEEYGIETLTHKGVRYIRYDVLDRKRVSLRGTLNAAKTVVTIDAPEPDSVFERWMGVSDGDIGASVRLATGVTQDEGTGQYDLAGATADETAVIADVTDWKTFTLDAALTDASFASATDVYVEVTPLDRMYGLYFDEDEGVHMLYGTGEEDESMAPEDDEYGAILGFMHFDAGRLQVGGRWYIDQLTWWGNPVVGGVHACARMSHFTFPT